MNRKTGITAAVLGVAAVALSVAGYLYRETLSSKAEQLAEKVKNRFTADKAAETEENPDDASPVS